MKSTNSNQKKYLLAGIATFAVLGVIGLYFLLPNWFFSVSIARFKDYKSFRVQYLPPSPDIFKFEALIHTNQSDLSKYVLEINSINNENGNNLAFDLLSSKTDQYLNVNYSKIKTVEGELARVYPPILELETYKRTLPIIEGKSYLHLSSSDLDPLIKNKDVTSLKLKKDDQDRLTKLSRSMYVLRSFNPFYQYQGQTYTKIVYGLDKGKLLEIIKVVKDSDLDIKVSQLNAIKKAIEDTSGWNSNLVEMLIDKHQNLYKVTLRLPQIPETVLSDDLVNSLSDQKNIQSAIKQATSQVKNKINSQINSDKQKLVELGSVTFDQLNSVKNFEKPQSVVEIKSIFEVAEKELKPLIASILTGQPLVVPTTTKQPTTTGTVKPPRPAGCLIYQITNGPLASKKCYAPADAESLSKLVQQRNNVVANNKVAFENAQTRCDQGDKDACQQAQNTYSSATAQISSLESQIRAIIKRGW